MGTIDTPTLVNWIVAGFIGLIFGTLSAWITHRYARKRDNMAWEREKEKLQEQFSHEREMLVLQFEQRAKESQQQLSQEQSSRVKDELLKGVDNPWEAIEDLQRSAAKIHADTDYGFYHYPPLDARRRRLALADILVATFILVGLCLLVLSVIINWSR